MSLAVLVALTRTSYPVCYDCAGAILVGDAFCLALATVSGVPVARSRVMRVWSRWVVHAGAW
eukprot:12695537-Alexandrium_andersonii.AAC.1